MPSVGKERKPFPLKKKTPSTGASSGLFSPVEVDKNVKMLLYGRGGTGKTSFWATFDEGEIGCCLCSNRIGELKSLSKEARKRTHTTIIKGTDDLNAVVEYQKETGRFSMIVLDHVTAYQDRLLANILGMENVVEQKYWGLASQQQYGQCSLQFKESIGRLIDLDCHIILIGQEREFGTEEEMLKTGILPSVGADAFPKVSPWLTSITDYACRTFIRKEIKKSVTKQGKVEIETEEETGEVEYCMLTYPDAVYTTKFRIPKGGKLPKEIVDPNWKKFLEIANQ